MKNVYLIIISFLIFNTVSYAQRNTIRTEKANFDYALNKKLIEKSKNSRELKQVTTTVYHEFNFSGGLPTGWTLSDNAGIGGWIFIDQDTSYTGAHTENNEGVIYGATSGGYMHLPADFYNCVPNVWPREMINNPVDVDATMETDWLDISMAPSGIVLQYSTFFRLCCSQENTSLDINITTDGSNWTTLNGRDIEGEVYMNDYPNDDNVAYWIRNISSFVSGSDSVKIQFRMHSGSHYFWSIDDVLLLEPESNDLSIKDYYAGKQVFTTNYEDYEDYNFNYSEIPQNIKYNVQLGALITQKGINAENARMEFSLDSVNTQNIWSQNSTTSIVNFGLETINDSTLYSDTINNYQNGLTFYNPELTYFDYIDGDYLHDGIPYTIHYFVNSDNPDNQISNNSKTYEIAQTLGRYSYHWQSSSGWATCHKTIGPFSYSSPTGAIGDIFANKFDFYQESGEIFKIYGLRIFIPENEKVTFDAAGNGCTFTPILFIWDDNANGGAGDYVELTEVSGVPHTLFEGEEGFYVYLSFEESEVENHNFIQGSYLVGISMLDYNSQKIAIGVDESYRQGDAHFLMKIDPWQDTWYYWGAGGSVMIDVYTSLMQMLSEPYSIITRRKENLTLQVFPNPAKDYIVVASSSLSSSLSVVEGKVEGEAEGSILKIYNLSGQLVKSFPLVTERSRSVGETGKVQIPISDLQSGVYFVKVGTQMQKLVVE